MKKKNKKKTNKRTNKEKIINRKKSKKTKSKIKYKIKFKKKSKKKIKNRIKSKLNLLKSKKIIKIKKNFLKKNKVKEKKFKYSSNNQIVKIIRLQEKIKSKFKFKFKFSLEKAIINFFQRIENKINEFKTIQAEEKRKRQLEEIHRMQKEKIAIDKKKKLEKKLQLEKKKIELREEIKLERERTKDIKLFLRKEQALIRKEQAEKQKKFLEELKIERQIEKFRIREIKELEKLEKISLKEQRADYSGLQERIEKLKAKYRIIRDQKIRERVEALGVQVQEDDDRETLLQKEKDYRIERQKIEDCLESFYRSASSLVFQLNKRHITRHMSIFRCIDKRFETGEIFIKWDESSDEEWLVLIYIKDNIPSEGIIIEDKSNPEKNIIHELQTTEIFKASDLMVDSLTQLLAKEREKNKKS